MPDLDDIEESMGDKQFYGYWYENKIDGTMYIGKGSGSRIYGCNGDTVKRIVEFYNAKEKNG